MADRILHWFIEEPRPGMALPAYHIEAEYETAAVRIRAETAPVTGDAAFSIRDDGTSIMADKMYRYADYITNTPGYTGNTDITLPHGALTEEMADDFNNTPIAVGSWVTLAVIDGCGAKNVSIQLELTKLSEDDEDDE